MVQLLGSENFKVVCYPGKRIVVAQINNKISTFDHDNKSNENESNNKERILHLECNDMFNITNIEIADIVMLETDIPSELNPQLCQLLENMHEGARTLTYLDLRKIWNIPTFSFRQLESNRYLSDRFPTSWSVQRGHHFYLWIKVSDNNKLLILFFIIY